MTGENWELGGIAGCHDGLSGLNCHVPALVDHIRPLSQNPPAICILGTTNSADLNPNMQASDLGGGDRAAGDGCTPVICIIGNQRMLTAG